MTDSHLTVGGAAILLQENGFDPLVVALFNHDELRHPHQPFGPHRYQSTARVLQDRLDVLGFDTDHARAELDAAVDDWHESQPSISLFTEEEAPRSTSTTLLASAQRYVVGDDGTVGDASGVPLDRIDPRSQVRLLIDLAPTGDIPVSYVIREHLDHDQLEPCPDLAGEVRRAAASRPTRTTPTIVLTEGRSDARHLRSALGVTHPHLVGHITFMDFEVKPQGGASALLTLAKGLAAAGVGDRFVAIADNDTAARVTLESDYHLPSNFRMLRYPELALLADYPTLGPQSEGTVNVDLNGRAGSLEMYFGRDVLTDDNGDLFPVQWTGYESKVGAYQGSLSSADKAHAQARFQTKVEQYHAGIVNPDADWDGVRSIIDTIVRAFTNQAGDQ